MFEPDWQAPEPSFRQSIADPGTEPDAGPLVCVFVSKSWQPILVGCALQVCQPQSWDVSDPTALADLLDRSYKLLLMIALADECVPSESGSVSITIPAGDGTASATVTFTGTYATAPQIVVSCNDITLAATWSDVTSTQFTAHLTASVPVTSDTTATVSWAALV